MNRLTKFKKKIQKMMSSSYEPSLADSNRIYKEYCINEGRISEVLSDVYDWLAQEPICIDYKKGKIYMRCEATNSPDILCVHYFYINEEKNIKIEDFNRRNTFVFVKSISHYVKRDMCHYDTYLFFAILKKFFLISLILWQW